MKQGCMRRNIWDVIREWFVYRLMEGGSQERNDTETTSTLGFSPMLLANMPKDTVTP